MGIDINHWDITTRDCGNWKSIVKTAMSRGEYRPRAQLAERRDPRKQGFANAAFSAADADKIITPELDFLITPGDAYPRIGKHCSGKPLSDKTDGRHNQIAM